MGAAVFLLFLVAILIFQVIRLQKAENSLQWPSTNGQIVHAGIKTVSDGNYGTAEVPDIRFKYLVNGVEYTGKQLSYGAGGGSTDSVVARYRPGSTVLVYHNPSKPSEAVLIPGSGTSNYLIVAWMLFLALIFILAWIGGIVP
jgi:hypothetical protein